MTSGLTVAALDLSGRIQDVGAYAGFAAIVGLAVLSLLYFGQARELKRLREWAGRAPERTVELQQQAAAAAAAQAQARTVAPPAPRPAAATPPPAAAPRPRTSVPATPGARVPEVPANGAGQATEAIPAVAAADAAPGGTAAGVRPVGLSKTPPVAAVGAEVGAGVGAGTAAAGGLAGGLGEDTGRERAVPLRSGNAARAAGVGGSQRPRTVPEATLPEPERAGPGPVVLGAVGAVAVALVIVVLLVAHVFGGGGSSSKKPTAQTGTSQPAAGGGPSGGSSTKPSTAKTVRVVRGDYSTFVLNGTTASGRASDVLTKLTDLGFQRGGFMTAAATPTPPQITKVFYRGQANRPAALEVAKLLSVARADVMRVPDSITSQAATAASTGTTGATGKTGAQADVFVLIGADKASG